MASVHLIVGFLLIVVSPIAADAQPWSGILSPSTGMTVGNYLALDQADDSNTDTGTIWVCQTLGVCSNDGPSGSGAPGRIQSQRVKITAINGNTVTISPPVAMPNWRTSQSP